MRSQQVNELEKMNILEPGEQVVLNFDNIKEINRVMDGRIYLTNYRVRLNTLINL